MIIVMKQDAAKDDVTKIVAKIENAGLKTHLSVGRGSYDRRCDR